MTDLTRGIMTDGFTFRKIKQNPAARLALALTLIIAGALLIIFPGIGTEIAVMFLGAALIAFGGAVIFADALKKLRVASAYMLPAVCITCGALLIIFRTFTASLLLPAMVGLWAVCEGVTHLVLSVKVKGLGGYWKSRFLLAVILIVLGACVLTAMFLGGNAIGVLLGLALITFALPLLRKI